MHRRALLGAGLASAAAACGADSDVWEFRYRLKLVGFIAQRHVEGESVFTTRYRYVGNIKGSNVMLAVGWGRAITLDLGDAGLLFAILDAVPQVQASHAFPPRARDILATHDSRSYDNSDLTDGTAFEGLRERLGREEYAMARHQWPLFVRFGDVRDASTAQLVEVADQRYSFSSSIASRTFEQAYGEGARITGVSIAQVDTRLRPSSRIERDLPCVEDLGPPDDDEGNLQRPLHQLLHLQNFQLTGQLG